jgi:hippurate hydrolase
MLEDGLFTKYPRPDMALALHCDGALATGKIGVRPGYTLANVDSVNVTMNGRGGHGAAPHTTIDPIVQAAEFIVSLQTLVSREMNPIEPAVVTVGSIHGGTKHNIIGDKCVMQLTVRSYSPAVREKLLAGIRRKAEAAAASANAQPPTVEVLNEYTPSLYNDDKLVERVTPVLRKLLGDDNVVTSEPAMGGEDFSRYGLAGCPIFMYRLGTIEPTRLAGLTRGGAEPPSLHSAAYFPDAELSLKTGVSTMCAAVLDLLPKKK